jgi:hypothetical protein
MVVEKGRGLRIEGYRSRRLLQGRMRFGRVLAWTGKEMMRKESKSFSFFLLEISG